MSRAFEVAVVGAGVVGAAVAHECAARGASVVLLERDRPGRQASGAAAGMLAPCSEAHQAGPFLDLGRRSLALWPQLAERLRADGGGDPELDLCGLLRLAADDAAAKEVQARLAWQGAAGIDAGSWVDADAARELEPALVPGACAGAAWYPGEGHVNSRRAVAAMVEAARRRGAVVRGGAEVVGPAAAPGGEARGVRLRDGEVIGAGAVVLGGGAWLGGLAAAFGAELPVRPVHGQVAVLRGLPTPPRRVVFAGLLGYAVAKRNGTVLVGATAEDRGFATAPRQEVTERLVARAAGLLRGVERATVVDAWAGLRPCAPDDLPLLGPLPGRDDHAVVVAGAHYRNGVLLAPATAEGVADMVLDGRTPAGWEAFDPRRLG